MTRQITVRLPDDVVDFIDTEVKNGDARSRAAVVTRALERERRRDVAARDARILSEGSADDDLDALAGFNAGRTIDVP